jgi:hypothetical protein
MTTFEDRLLTELQTIVREQPAEAPTPAHRPRGRRRLVIAGATAGVLAIAAAVGVPFLSRGPAPAYAVTPNGNGSVSVEISSLRDAAGLEQKLRDNGIPAVVRYLPAGKMCKQPWFTPAGPGVAGPMSGSVQGSPGGGATRFTISSHLPAGVTLVITTQGGGSFEPTSVGVALAQGTVPPCTVVDAPAGSPPFGPPPAGAQVQTGSSGGPSLQTGP